MGHPALCSYHIATYFCTIKLPFRVTIKKVYLYLNSCKRQPTISIKFQNQTPIHRNRLSFSSSCIFRFYSFSEIRFRRNFLRFAWSSTIACKNPTIFRNLGYNATLRHLRGDVELLRNIRCNVRNVTHFRETPKLWYVVLTSQLQTT